MVSDTCTLCGLSRICFGTFYQTPTNMMDEISDYFKHGINYSEHVLIRKPRKYEINNGHGCHVDCNTIYLIHQGEKNKIAKCYCIE